MDWISGLQSALDYVEEHITEDLDAAAIAGRAACSEFYFQRFFGFLCGMTLGEYIRNRRLTLAGSELSGSDKKVIDVALRYGYDSPESFTRAFVKFHGITPSEAKRDGSALKSFSRLTVQLKLTGGNIMNYKILEKQAFTLIEKAEQHSVDGAQNKNTIPAFWTRAKLDGTVDTLLAAANDKSYLFGVCYGNSRSDQKTFEYAIAAPCGEEARVPEGFRKRTIPARTWVVVECVGAMPEAIQRTWHNICSEFFPVSGYRPTFEMDIEAYPDGDTDRPDYRSEIWVPVVKE